MSQVQVNSMNLMKFGLGFLFVKEKKDGTKNFFLV